jgi:hypothetical protein
MGFNTTATTTTLTAKLTPIGRQRLVSTNNSLISAFSLGDSDANYYSPLTLSTGSVPSEAGDLGVDSSFNNSTTQNVDIRSFLIVNGSGALQKSVEPQSITINSETVHNGLTTVSGSNLTHFTVNRTNVNSDSRVNLFYSFGLPLNTTDDFKYTGTTYANGGYSDTALSGVAQNSILVFGIDNSKFGETLDGKSIYLKMTTLTTPYNIYSTYQSTSTATKVQDANLRDTSTIANTFGSNIAFLFSDEIKKPNGGDSTLSWATGFGLNKPFSVNQKQLYNLQTNINTATSADTVVGIAYLDKGIIVLTHPQIVAAYNSSATTSGSVVTIDSVSTSVFQNITCIAARGEFGASINSTFSSSDTPRISEVGLYDSLGNLIAKAKTDRHITKNINEFLALNIKISL